MTIASPYTAWREAWPLLKQHRTPLSAAVLLVGLSRVAALGLPAAARIVVDQVVGQRRTDLLLPVALLVSLAIAVEVVCSFAATQVAGIAGQKAVAALRRELGSHAMRLPMRALDDAPSSAIAARIMTDTDQVRYVIGSGAVQLAASLLTAGLALGLMVWLEPSLTIMVVLLLTACAAVTTRAFHRITRSLEEVLRQQSALAGSLAQRLAGTGIAKAYAAERREASGFTSEAHGLLRKSVEALRHLSLVTAGGTLTSESLGVLLLVGGAWSVTAGRMTIGSSVMYAWLAGWLMTPVLHVAAGAGELAKAGAALRRIAELKRVATEDEEDRLRHRVGRVTGRVEFDGVSFAYLPGRTILRDISLHCPPGSTTALVGPNGSGKSTLCRLLLAYDRPTAGRILLDGRDLASLHRRSYRANLGTVLQDELLISGTIADSIRYGRPGASVAQVEACGRLAHCDEFVGRLPHGYATSVGDRGSHLSAGQRQLVAIARAFLADPRILVLDEATSNLDAESERWIVAALRSLCRGRTTFIIAHRASTIRIADQIVVLDQGSVREAGIRQGSGSPLLTIARTAHQA